MSGTHLSGELFDNQLNFKKFEAIFHCKNFTTHKTPFNPLTLPEQLNDKDLLDQLRNENFDLGLSEYFDICSLAIFHKIGVKRWILLYSNPMPLADMRLFGVPATPSSTPSAIVSWNTEQMSLWERFFNWVNYFAYDYYFRDMFLGQTAKAFPPEVPHYTDLMSRSQYVFVNMDEYLDFPRPVPFKYVNIGGIGMKKLGDSSGISDPVSACGCVM